MSALDGWIDICRAGTWRDTAGRAVRLDEDRLDRIVADHEAADPAPIFVGHPETDAPAYAWVDALRRVGDRLQAKLRDVAPSFREAVEAGRYSGRSIALEGDRLRHVGFLGGSAPAVPGLAPTHFGRAPETVVAFDRDESDVPSPAAAPSSDEDHDEESADTPASTVDDTDGTGGRDETQDDGGAGSLDDSRPPHPDPLRTHGPTGDEGGASFVPLSAPEGRRGDSEGEEDGGDTRLLLPEREAMLNEREAALLVREAALVVDERRRKADAALAPHVEAGRVLPAERASLAALLAALDEEGSADGADGTAGATRSIAFASADGSAVRMHPAALLERFLEGLPRRVDYRTLAPAPAPGVPDGEGSRRHAGEDSERIAAEARALMAAEAERGMTLTPAEAVDRARAGRGLGIGGGN